MFKKHPLRSVPCLLALLALGCTSDELQMGADAGYDVATTDGSTDSSLAASPDAGEVRSDAGPTDARIADSAVPDSAVPDVNVSPSSGCGLPAVAGFTCMEVDFDGAARTWCMNIPESYDPARAYSLILGLHGCGGNAANVHRHRANMEAYGEADFLFAYPQAAASCWDYGRGNDTDFIRSIMETINTNYCISEGSAFVHGMSSGGSMSSSFAGSGLVRAYASVSAGGSGAGMPAWYYSGRTDGYYSTIISGIEARVRGNGCSAETQPIPDTPCVEYQGCDYPVVHCEDDRGHVWPGETWAQEGMIDFFRAAR